MVRAGWLVFACAACAPDLDDTTSLVDAPRLLATRGEPAEVAPGATIATTALWATPTGTLADAPLQWAFCSARKTFSEPGPVAAACLVEASDDLVVFGTGASANGAVPANACRQFGPDAPDPLPGEPAGRPADPDGTGGFYQPVRVRATAPDEAYVLGQLRIRCGLPGATAAQAAEFRTSYVANTNPSIAELIASPVVHPGDTVDLAVHWPHCETAPCEGSEPYVWFDPVARQLTRRREAMRVSWFATAGSFATGHTGRAESEADQAFANNQWSAPSTAGEVHLWAVLRDDRGGVTWTALRIAVQ